MFKTDKGKVIVNDYLEVQDFPGVFAIGDCALFLDPKTERPFPPTAQIAEAQAKTAAKNLKALIKNSQKEKFVYHSKGTNGNYWKEIRNCHIFGNEHLWILGMVDLEKCLSFKNSNF